jgi:hypothetical protein
MDADQQNTKVLYISNRVLTVMAAAVSSEHDKFTGWLVAGLGAALAWLLANGKASLIGSDALKIAVRIYLVIIICHALQRMAGAIVASSVAAGDRAMALLKDDPLMETPPELVARVLDRLEDAFLWPFSIIVRRSYLKLKAGRLDTSGRLLVRLAQTQTYLMAIQVLLGVGVVATLTIGLL